MKMFLFRHGESEWNSNKDAKYSEENHNSNLTELGLEQAKKNANYLKDKNITSVYSSPLKRAFQTANELAKIINVKIQLNDNLREFSIYDDSCFGLTRDEIYDKIGRELYKTARTTKDQMMDWRPLKGETRREARTRFINTINEICAKSKDEVIAISSHGAILGELIYYYNFECSLPLNNCDIIELSYTNKTFNFIQKIENSTL